MLFDPRISAYPIMVANRHGRVRLVTGYDSREQFVAQQEAEVMCQLRTDGFQVYGIFDDCVVDFDSIQNLLSFDVLGHVMGHRLPEINLGIDLQKNSGNRIKEVVQICFQPQRSREQQIRCCLCSDCVCQFVSRFCLYNGFLELFTNLREALAVLAIISKYDVDRPPIPFFSKVALRYTKRRLDSLGCTMAIKNIRKNKS